MLVLLLELRRWWTDGEVYPFAVFMAVVWSLWVLRILLADPGRRFDDLYVRHEAPLTEWRRKAATTVLSQQGREAEDSRTREMPGTVESSPDNAGTFWNCQTGRVRQARREGVREEPVREAP